jgi:hypothetical protein
MLLHLLDVIRRHAQRLAFLATAYVNQLLLESAEAWALHRRPGVHPRLRRVYRLKVEKKAESPRRAVQRSFDGGGQS